MLSCFSFPVICCVLQGGVRPLTQGPMLGQQIPMQQVYGQVPMQGGGFAQVHMSPLHWLCHTVAVPPLILLAASLAGYVLSATGVHNSTR